MKKTKKVNNNRTLLELIGGISILAGFGYLLISKLVMRIYGSTSTGDSLTGGWNTGDYIFSSIGNIILAPFVFLLSLFLGGALYIGLKLTINSYNKLKQ